MRIVDVLDEWAYKMLSQGKLVRIDSDDMLVVGDIHGFPEVVYWVEKLWSETGARYLVFLGDYMDRGPDGPGVLERVGSLFLSEPGKVVTLRGNHENLHMNKTYGFYEQAVSMGGEKLLAVVSRLYYAMPYAAASGMYFMVHGGIPCRECTNTPEKPVSIDEIRASPESYGFHLMWNDPSADIDWYAPSIRGAYLYGVAAWKSFLEANKLHAILRGHEVADALRIHYPNRRVKEGRDIGDRMTIEGYSVVTVFSSRYHAGRAGALRIVSDQAEVYRYG